MKVYATYINDHSEVVLKTWPSKAAFQLNESWCDDKWINVATTDDLTSYEFAEKSGFIVYKDYQLESHRLLHELYLKVQPKDKHVPYFMT